MTTSARTTTLLSVAAGLLVLGLLLLSSRAPLDASELDQLRRSTGQAEALLALARLQCDLREEPADRAECHLLVDGMALPVKVARGVLTTADACPPGALGEGCQRTQIEQARVLLPEVRRLVETAAPGSSGAAAGDGPAVGVGPAPSGAP
jgi:hypothetical protein